MSEHSSNQSNGGKKDESIAISLNILDGMDG
jgi:hypothetical protein